MKRLNTLQEIEQALQAYFQEETDTQVIFKPFRGNTVQVLEAWAETGGAIVILDSQGIVHPVKTGDRIFLSR